MKERRVTEKQLDREASRPGNQLAVGTVKAFLNAREAIIEMDDGTSRHARQAVSCLLAPAIDDQVLVHDGGECHVLAVLERSGNHAAEIAVPDADAVTLRANGKLDLAAPSMTMTARNMHFVAHALTQTGEVLSQTFGRLLENVIDRISSARSITTTVDTRTATIREVETVKAGTLVQKVEHVSTQTSEIALVTARRDVRLDAERVSVG